MTQTMPAPSSTGTPGRWPKQNLRALPAYSTARTPDRHSDGPVAAALITDRLGRPPSPWQRLVLDVALERVDGPGSPFAYDQIGLIVGRRCGKTVTTMGVPLVRSMAGPVTLPNGRRLPFRAAHTAQNLTQARKRFLEDLVEPLKQSMPLPRWNAGYKVLRNLAMTTLAVDPFGVDHRTPRASMIQVYAPTPSSVRGDGLMSLTFDEALVFSAEEGEALMGSARPSMSEFGGHAQMYICSNVSLQTTATRWLSKLRDAGRGAVEAGRTAGIAYFEWTIPAGGDPLDERLWWDHYPALGDGIVGVDQLRRDLEELKEPSFAAEYLGAWPDESAVAQWVAFPEATFTAAATAAELPAGVPYALGVAIDPLGRDATIAAAAQTSDDGNVTAEILATGPDSRWIRGTLLALIEQGGPPTSVAINDYGAGHGLLADLAADDLPLLPIGAKDYPAACFDTETGLGNGSTTYRPHPALSAAAAHARHTTGRAWTWETRVAVSQSPVEAMTLATWAARHADAPIPWFVY